MKALARCLAVALVLAAGLLPAVAMADGPGVRIDPNFPPLGSGGSGGGSSRGGFSDRAPRGYDDGYQRRRSPRPQIYCDGYGRCFQRVPDRSRGFGTRPPGWADDLPGRIRYPDRFSRPRSGVVCDQATYICYRDGRVDRSETRDVFGDRAADRADDLRDRRGTSQLFVPERGVSCDAGQQVCFDGRTPDASLTRRYFGADAAARLD
jgi:hypothetical protein